MKTLEQVKEYCKGKIFSVSEGIKIGCYLRGAGIVEDGMDCPWLGVSFHKAPETDYPSFIKWFESKEEGISEEDIKLFIEKSREIEKIFGIFDMPLTIMNILKEKKTTTSELIEQLETEWQKMNEGIKPMKEHISKLDGCFYTYPKVEYIHKGNPKMYKLEEILDDIEKRLSSLESGFNRIKHD